MLIEKALNSYQIFLKEYNLKIKGVDINTYKKNLKLISNINRVLSKKNKNKPYQTNSSNELKEKDVSYFINIQKTVKEKTDLLLKEILLTNEYEQKILEDSNSFFSCLVSLCFLNIYNDNKNLNVSNLLNVI